MKYFLPLICLNLVISLTGISQKLYIQVKSETQTIEAFIHMMDEGAHAIHIEVALNEHNQPIVGKSDLLLLSDVIKRLEWHTKSYTRYEIKYIIELQESINFMKEAGVIHDLLDAYIHLTRVTIQSKDFKTLKYWKKNYPELKLAVFIDNQKSVNTNLANLGFKPTAYSSRHDLLTKKKVAKLHEKSIKVIPWKINDIASMQQLILLNVDGIITNTPDRSKLLGVNQEVKNDH